jgi:hypothetical protein
MKTNVQSHNTGLSPALKELLLPGVAQSFIDLTLAGVLLMILKINALWAYFTTGVLAGTQTDIGEIINQKAQGLHRFLDSISQGRFLQIVFWLFIGCIVYLLIWFTRSLFTNIRNDMIADEYVHPGGYNRAVYWESIIARKGFFACILIILIAFTIAGFKIAILLAQTSISDVESLGSAHSLFKMVSAVFITAVMIHIFNILARLLGRAWNLIYTDL